MAEAPVHSCCLKGFRWQGTPTGRTEKLAGRDVYVAGSNAEVGVLLVHDLYGWTFGNLRLLADQVASEADATVYMPDLFGGEVLSADLITAGRFQQLDLEGFMGRNGREAREPEIFACARALRADRGHSRVGMFGYCYGGWAGLRLGAEEHRAAPLVDCVSIGHPSLVVERDFDEVAVPVQILAPERDAAFSPRLKLHAFRALVGKGSRFDYLHLPGVEHSCLVRGSPDEPGEREAMAAGKDAVVAWLVAHLHDSAKA